MGHKEDTPRKCLQKPLPPASEEALLALYKLGTATRDRLAESLDGPTDQSRKRRAASLLAALRGRQLASVADGVFKLTVKGQALAKKLDEAR